MTIIAIIVAAGRGSRAGAGGPKQYRDLVGQSVLARTVTQFLEHPQITKVRVIIHRDDRDLYDQAMAALLDHDKLLDPVFGGAQRQDSVRLGLESLEQAAPGSVLIHDAARPFVDAPTISRVINALGSEGVHGAIAALPVFDTLKKAQSDTNAPVIDETISREKLWRAQTPQGFSYEAILTAHRNQAATPCTDDASIFEAEGLSVSLVTGSPDNMKITQAEDFGMARILLSREDSHGDTNSQGNTMNEFRTGQGFDVHAFEEGQAVVLCGVEMPHTHKLKGHSDADVGMHALTDAILGAIAQGDIGDHFPPSDPQWRGAPSHIFLEKACSLVREQNGEVTHCDITLICEAPKIGPHRQAMKTALSEIMGISADRISVKATTTEALGFTGRREGIAAMATATVRLEAPTS